VGACGPAANDARPLGSALAVRSPGGSALIGLDRFSLVTVAARGRLPSGSAAVEQARRDETRPATVTLRRAQTAAGPVTGTVGTTCGRPAQRVEGLTRQTQQGVLTPTRHW